VERITSPLVVYITWHRLLTQQTDRVLPFIYTPTVGEACVRYFELQQRLQVSWQAGHHRLGPAALPTHALGIGHQHGEPP